MTEICDHPFISPMSAHEGYCGGCDSVLDMGTGEIVPDPVADPVDALEH